MNETVEILWTIVFGISFLIFVGVLCYGLYKEFKNRYK